MTFHQKLNIAERVRELSAQGAGMTDPTIAAWSRESDLLFALRQLREENELLKTKSEWQGLTDEEYEAMAEQYVTNCYFDTLKYAQGIEAKLKEKNGY
jgi:hypothetical protein